jgi:hypothetical protein
MPLISDLKELKSTLEIDPNDHTEDKNLLFYLEWATDMIALYLNLPHLFYKERTEYYQGTGTTKLVLKRRPVYIDPVPQVWVDTGGNYGQGPGVDGQNPYGPQTKLVWGTDFVLRMDGDIDNTSRSGILFRLKTAWPVPSYRQPGYLSPFWGPDIGSVKITYTAGFTIDNLPSVFRAAANLLVAKLRYMFPLGIRLTSESYEERAIGIAQSDKDYLLSLVKPLIFQYKNYKF